MKNLKKLKKGIVSTFIVALIYSLSLNLSFYSDIYASNADLRTRQQQINTETQAIQQSLNAVTEQMTAAQRQVYEIESELRKVESELNTINTELDRTVKLLEETAIELEIAEELREEQQERLVQRARFMHMNGRTSYIDIILNAGSFSDLLRRIDYVNRIVEHDQELVTQLQKTEAIIAEKLEITYIQEQNLRVLEAQQSSRRAEYESIRAQRVAILNSLEQEERELLEQMWALEQSNREVERLIREAEQAQRPSSQPSNNRVIVDTSNLNGRMAWPVPGRSTISSGYGNRRSPISGRNEFHTGIDIPAPAGTNIIAADGGTVIFSGWMNGYGNTIIIDHGGGISTLYAHNSRNLVSVGQRVERGQVIAHVGSTGFSTGNHLHFEVRVHGSHTNPMPFFG